jgi:hypothetical protein
MRFCFPLLPAWAVGLWLLLTSASVWDANALARSINGGSMAAGWVVLGFLVVGSVLYVGAPFFGRQLAVSSNATSTVGIGESNAAQRAFGAGVVRILVLVGLYLYLGCRVRSFG